MVVQEFKVQGSSLVGAQDSCICHCLHTYTHIKPFLSWFAAAGQNDDDKEDDKELDALDEEANLPIEELLAR